MNDNAKRKYDIRVTPEDMVPGIAYCFNLNPECQPSDFEDGHIIGATQQWADAIKRKLRTLRYCYGQIFLEISREGRLHFHGNITVSKQYTGRFYVKDIAVFKRIGSFKLSYFEESSNSNYKKWQDYCDKQKDVILEFCKQEQIDREFFINNVVDPQSRKLNS